jgi:hypothetical protein
MQTFGVFEIFSRFVVVLSWWDYCWSNRDRVPGRLARVLFCLLFVETPNCIE